MPPLKSDVHWLSFLLRVKTTVSMAFQLKTQNSLTSGRLAEFWALRLSEKQNKLVTYRFRLRGRLRVRLRARLRAPLRARRAGSIGSPSSGSARSSDPLLGSKLALSLSAERLRTKKSGLERGELGLLYFFAGLERDLANCGIQSSKFEFFRRIQPIRG